LIFAILLCLPAIILSFIVNNVLILCKKSKMNNETNLNQKDASLAQMLADGKTITDIAVELNVKSRRTIETKFISAKKRALVKTLPQLVAIYFRKGMIK